MYKIFTIIFAGSILKIEPKRFSSGLQPEPELVFLFSVFIPWTSVVNFFLTYRIIFTPLTFMIAHLLKVTILMCHEEVVQS